MDMKAKGYAPKMLSEDSQTPCHTDIPGGWACRGKYPEDDAICRDFELPGPCKEFEPTPGNKPCKSGKGGCSQDNCCYTPMHEYRHYSFTKPTPNTCDSYNCGEQTKRDYPDKIVCQGGCKDRCHLWDGRKSSCENEDQSDCTWHPHTR